MAADSQISILSRLERASSLVPIYKDHIISGYNIPILVNYHSLYKAVKVLGSGVTGKVMLVEDKRAQELVAIKMIRFNSQNSNDIFREIEVLRELSNKIPGIPKYYDSFIINLETPASGLLGISMEYIEGISLELVIKNLRKEDLVAPGIIIKFAYWLFEVINYLHQHNIVHRDIKPANIIINEKTGEFYLVDFGFSCFTDTVHTYSCRSTEFKGTPMYESPEILQRIIINGDISYFKAADVWAAAVTLVEFSSLTTFYSGYTKEGLIEFVLQEPIKFSLNHQLETEYPTFRTILEECFDLNPQTRLTAAEAHSLLQELLIN